MKLCSVYSPVIVCSHGCVQDGSEEDDGNNMDDDSLSDWNLSKSLYLYQSHLTKIGFAFQNRTMIVIIITQLLRQH